jgi:hypothetical protein
MKTPDAMLYVLRVDYNLNNTTGMCINSEHDLSHTALPVGNFSDSSARRVSLLYPYSMFALSTVLKKCITSRLLFLEPG